jgi:hypothetical protein
MFRLRDTIHGVASSRDIRLKELRGTHAASPLRWWGSFGGRVVERRIFVPLRWLAGSSLALKFIL